MTKFTQKDPGEARGNLMIAVGIDDGNNVRMRFDTPMSNIALHPETCAAVAVELLGKSMIALGRQNPGLKPLAALGTDEAIFRRDAHKQVNGTSLPADEEHEIDIDMGHWTLRVVVGPRGLAELRKAVAE